jgi:hypothetical protein
VTTESEEVLHQSMQREKTLRLRPRFEATHLSFSLTSWLVRDFRSVVRVLARVVRNRRHHFPIRRTVAAQLVRHQSVWLAALPAHKLSQESFRRALITTRSDENVDQVAVLIDRAPQILLSAADPYEHLVEVPRISQAPLATLGSARVSGSELQTPASNGFI